MQWQADMLFLDWYTKVTDQFSGGAEYMLKGGNCVQIIVSSLWTVVYFKLKVFALWQANSFLLKQTTFQKGQDLHESKKSVT